MALLQNFNENMYKLIKNTNVANIEQIKFMKRNYCSTPTSEPKKIL